MKFEVGQSQKFHLQAKLFEICPPYLANPEVQPQIPSARQ